MRFGILVAVMLASAASAMAAVQMSITGPGGSFTTPVEDPPDSKQWVFSVRKVNVPGDPSPTVFSVLTTDPQDVLKLVTMESRSPGEVLQLNLGINTANRVGDISEVVIGSDPLDDDGQSHLQVFSSGNVTRLEANRLLDSRIGGELYDGAVMKPYAAWGLPGKIDTLIVTGSITGTVWAQPYLPGSPAEQPGTIDRIEANAIFAKTEGPFPVGIYAGQRIGSIIAGSIVDTVIAARHRASPFNGRNQYITQVGRVEVGSTIGGPGTFHGELLATRFGDGVTQNPGFFCTGNFDGFIAVGEEFVTNGNPLLTPEMKFGPDGVRGQIHIGATRSASDIQTPTPWTAPLKIGPDGPGQIVLTGSSVYEPDDIGGGLVGRRPFNVISSLCVPAQFSTVSPRNVEVLWQFSGPVKSRVGPNNPALLLLRLQGSPGPNMSTCFESAGYQYDLAAGTVRVIPAYLPPGSYFVDLAFSDTGGVGELSEPPVPYFPGGQSFIVSAPFGETAGNVSPFEADQIAIRFTQRFTVVDPCPGDFNNDGQRNTADLTLLLGKFGTSQPCGAPEDMNVSFAVDTPDLTAFLPVLGTPCTSGRPGSGSPEAGATRAAETAAAPPQELGRPGSGDGAGAAPVPPVLAALGFTTIEGYTTWVSGLTPTELNAHIVELIETIERLELP